MGSAAADLFHEWPWGGNKVHFQNEKVTEAFPELSEEGWLGIRQLFVCGALCLRHPSNPTILFTNFWGEGGSLPFSQKPVTHIFLENQPNTSPPPPPAPGMFATLGSRPVINVKKWTQNYSGTFGAGSLCFANPLPWESRPEGWSASDGSNSATIPGLSRE